MKPADRPHSIHLQLRIDGTAPVGQASLNGGDPRAFSGWVGLVRAVEDLVTEDREVSGINLGSAQPGLLHADRALAR
jgi:hypothetical protein